MLLRQAPHNMRISRKRVRRIMAEKGLLQTKKRRKISTTDSNHTYRGYPNRIKGMEVTQPDQIWVSDITYIHLRMDIVYLAIVMDVFTRTIRGWCVSQTLDQELSLNALRKALQTHVPEIHHSDHGSQYAAYAYTDMLKKHGVGISMASVGKATENGYAERLMRTIKEEEVYLSEYLDCKDAREQIKHFIEDVYNVKRIHSSLGYLTPVMFEQAWRQSRLLSLSSLRIR